MCNHTERIGTFLAATIFVSALAMPVDATAQSGKIVCWKDKAGKVIGCGDKVPPEFQGSGTKELDSRGVTRKTTESADDAARLAAVPGTRFVPYAEVTGAAQTRRAPKAWQFELRDGGMLQVRAGRDSDELTGGWAALQDAVAFLAAGR